MTAKSPPGDGVGWFALATTLLQVSRPGFWSITLWLYLLPTGGGAGGTNTGGAALMGCSFWAGLVFCGAPLNLMVYLWNDLVDQDTDRVNPRKGRLWGAFGARASPAALRQGIRATIAVQAPFLAYFAWCLGVVWTSCWFAAVVTVNGLYNSGPRLSSRPPFDLVAPFGYLLVVPLSVALNGTPAVPAAALVHTAFFVVRSQLWFELFDIASDKGSKRQTTAVAIGLAGTRLLLCAVVGCEAAFVWWSFTDLTLRVFSVVSLAVAGAGLVLRRTTPPDITEMLATGAILGAVGSFMWHATWHNGALSGYYCSYR